MQRTTAYRPNSSVEAVTDNTSRDPQPPVAQVAASTVVAPRKMRELRNNAAIARIASGKSEPQEEPAGPAPESPIGSTEIDSIRKEGLTARQLRIARKAAAKHGLEVTSDFDAVRRLRLAGIDPFQRKNVLELAAPHPKEDDPDQGDVQLPQTVPEGVPNLPSTERLDPMLGRIRAINDIQSDIARRRRRRSLLLLVRLAFFIGLPTLLSGWYFYSVATPMYATKSEFSDHYQ